MNDVMWYLSRSTGIVAAVLAVAALAWGFLFSARETGTRYRPAWWLDLHNWLGGIALIFTIAHIATSYLNSDAGLSLASLFVPGVAPSQRLALAWGVVATYLIATAVLTSWPRRLFSRANVAHRAPRLRDRRGTRLRARLPDGHGRIRTSIPNRHVAARRRRHLHAVHPTGRGGRQPPSRRTSTLRFTAGTQPVSTWVRTAPGSMDPWNHRPRSDQRSSQGLRPTRRRDWQHCTHVASRDCGAHGSEPRRAATHRARRVERPARRPRQPSQSPPTVVRTGRRTVAEPRRDLGPGADMPHRALVPRPSASASPRPEHSRRCSPSPAARPRPATQVAAASIVASPRPASPPVPATTVPTSTLPHRRRPASVDRGTGCRSQRRCRRRGLPQQVG